jgi:hypothetical protein
MIYTRRVHIHKIHFHLVIYNIYTMSPYIQDIFPPIIHRIHSLLVNRMVALYHFYLLPNKDVHPLS